MTVSFESDLRSAVGTVLGVSPWVEVTVDRVDEFANSTGDHHWIHVDPERAATGPYGAPVAHGFWTLALVAEFSRTMFDFAQTKAIVNYGLDRVRFIGPVYVGDSVRATGTLTSLTEHAQGVDLHVNYSIVSSSDTTRPVCVADHITRLYL